MKINELIQYNNKTIQTKLLKESGFTTRDINKLIRDGVLTRTRRGFYKVTIKLESDIKLMKYYLKNSCFDELKDYFDSLIVKNYDSYYYMFLASIQTGDYENAYNHLYHCAELNKEEKNKINIYSYLLLLSELVELPKEKLDEIKIKLFDKNYYLDAFLECLLNKDYENAYNELRKVKENKILEKFEVNILRDLSIKAAKVYNKKNSKELVEFKQLFNELYFYVCNNNYELVYMAYNKLQYLNEKLELDDRRLRIIKDLLQCFEYIVNNQQITLYDYETNYIYGDNLEDNFRLAIKRNDYIKALEFSSKIYESNPSQEMEIYKLLLERIYNFLNIRNLINSRNPMYRRKPLNHLIENKKYEEALQFTKNDNSMDIHSKTIVETLLESILSIDSKKIIEN